MIKRFNPSILIRKPRVPVVYIDTFLWRTIINDDFEIKELLQKCCEDNLLVIVFSNATIGELKQRNLYDSITRICKNALLVIPVGRISANQIIHSLICYFEDNRSVILDWELAISDVPILQERSIGLRKLMNVLEEEINRAKKHSKFSKEKLVAILMDVQRRVWKFLLKYYRQLLKESQLFNTDNFHRQSRTYEKFFYTDYFTDLPSMVLGSYLFAYVIKERTIKVNDIVDIYNISEILPYTSLYIMDKDQHKRLKMLQKHWPIVFGGLEDLTVLSSSLKEAEIKPFEMLSSYLKSLRLKRNT